MNKDVVILALGLLTLALTGCQRTERTLPCEAGELPASFESLRADLPPFMRVCGGARGQTIYVDLEGSTSAREAWLAIVDHFEAQGWERTSQRIEGGENLTVELRKGERMIHFSAIRAQGENEPVRDLLFTPRVRASLMILR